MHTIKLNIQDNIFDKVIYFLQHLPKDEVKIIDDTTIIKRQKIDRFNTIKLHTKDFKFDRKEANAR